MVVVVAIFIFILVLLIPAAYFLGRLVQWVSDAKGAMRPWGKGR